MTTTKCILDEKCKQSSVTLEGVKYTLTRRSVIEGDGCVFTVDEPNKEKEQILLTKQEVKALFMLISTKG